MSISMQCLKINELPCQEVNNRHCNYPSHVLKRKVIKNSQICHLSSVTCLLTMFVKLQILRKENWRNFHYFAFFILNFDTSKNHPFLLSNLSHYVHQTWHDMNCINFYDPISLPDLFQNPLSLTHLLATRHTYRFREWLKYWQIDR